jgi:carboxypeptidase Q
MPTDLDWLSISWCDSISAMKRTTAALSLNLIRRILCRMVVVVVFYGLLSAQQESNNSVSDGQILSEIDQNNELMRNIEYLSDVIGPRLTGSPQQRMASEWVEREFQRYGLTNIHQEKWMVAHSWTRETAEARVIAPISRRLTIVSAGWSPSTEGEVQGPVVYVSAKSPSELDKYKTKLNGAIVILDEPNTVSPLYGLGHPAVEFPLRAPYAESGGDAGSAKAFYETRTKFFEAQGVRAILRNSGNPYNLMRMSNVSTGNYEPGVIPTAFLSHEDYTLIWRLLKRGDVRLQLTIRNAFSTGPVETSNTVGELRGTERPDEVVILGAHLDSWDLASGSTDNGTGVVAIMEAARALHKLNLAPKGRSGLSCFPVRSRARSDPNSTCRNVSKELPKISAVLVNDTGTGPVVTIGVHENYNDIQPLQEILAPVSSRLHLAEPKLSRTFGSDYAPFNAAGVPGFSCIGDAPEYSETQHTQTDTFDKVREAGLVQTSQLLAVWAFNTAQYPTLLPRGPAK